MYPVSTCTAEGSFSNMKRLKTPLRSTTTDGRLSSLAILHIQKHSDWFDIDDALLPIWRVYVLPFAFEPHVYTIVFPLFLL